MEKEIYQVDLEPFRNLQGLLFNATNNINQIAKRVNSIGVIYKEDIGDMKKEIEHFSKELWQSIHCFLTGLREMINFYGDYKNTSDKTTP